MLGKTEGKRKGGVTEDEIVGWHHQLNQWTWAWACFRRWWRTGWKTGMLLSMGLQKVGHNWATVPTTASAICLWSMKWSEVKWSEVAQLYLTLCDPMDYSPPGSSTHRIFQARVLEWVAISFSSPTQGLKPGILFCRQMLYHLRDL